MAPDVGFLQRYVGEWILKVFSSLNDESQLLLRLFANSFDVRVELFKNAVSKRVTYYIIVAVRTLILPPKLSLNVFQSQKSKIQIVIQSKLICLNVSVNNPESISQRSGKIKYRLIVLTPSRLPCCHWNCLLLLLILVCSIIN